MSKQIPYGVSPSEEYFTVLPNGLTMAVDAESGDGTSYVRFLDANGGELLYWNSDEWAETPEEVMGAIMGVIMGNGKVPKANGRPSFYYWADDVKFRKGQRMTG